MCRAASFEELENPVYVESQKRRTADAYDWWSRVWNLARYTNGAIYGAALESLDERHRRVLDVGCGTGIMSAKLAASGRQVLGVDLSPAMVREARRKRSRNLDFVQGDAEHLPVEDGGFDAVVNLISFHHYPHGDRALAEFHRTLRPSGRLVLVIFDRDSLYIRLAQGVNQWTKPIAGDTWQKSLNEVLALANNAGFVRVQVKRVPYWIKTWLIVAERPTS
jgi:ubiquinone/menaquinone biosynthesis C-methylase UbiE